MKAEILELLKLKFESSNGTHGMTIPNILIHFGVDYSELKPILNDLHKENKIKVRKGINGHLIYYKQTK